MNEEKAKHIEIKMRLQLAGSSFNEIARELDLAHSTILNVSNSTGISLRVATAIASKIGSTPDVLWPGKYPSPERGGP